MNYVNYLPKLCNNLCNEDIHLCLFEYFFSNQSKNNSMKKKKTDLEKKLADLKKANKITSVKCDEDLQDANARLTSQNIAYQKLVIELSNTLKQIEDELEKPKIQTSNFAQHLIHVQEEEKAFFAKEIHDEFGQQLVVMKMNLYLLKRNKDKTIQEVEGSINTIMEKVDALIQALREIATTLRPGTLDTLGLIPSIEWQIKEFEKHSGIKCSIVINVEVEKFEGNVSICFFRICQEVLTNISKHAEAKNVQVNIFQNQEELSMTISDDGKGISVEKIDHPFSMGILGMKERAKIISADFSVTSDIGVGTVVELRLALNTIQMLP